MGAAVGRVRVATRTSDPRRSPPQCAAPPGVELRRTSRRSSCSRAFCTIYAASSVLVDFIERVAECPAAQRCHACNFRPALSAAAAERRRGISVCLCHAVQLSCGCVTVLSPRRIGGSKLMSRGAGQGGTRVVAKQSDHKGTKVQNHLLCHEKTLVKTGGGSWRRSLPGKF